MTDELWAEHGERLSVPRDPDDLSLPKIVLAEPYYIGTPTGRKHWEETQQEEASA